MPEQEEHEILSRLGERIKVALAAGEGFEDIEVVGDEKGVRVFFTFDAPRHGLQERRFDCDPFYTEYVLDVRHL